MAASELPSDIPLGKPTEYTETYAPSLLYPIERAQSRVPMGISEPLPFKGEDMWTAFELGWLNERGKPEVCTVRINVPCRSPCIVESKSLKMYLGSFAQTRFADRAEVLITLDSDLGAAFGAPLTVELIDLHQIPDIVHEVPGTCLDGLDVTVKHYQRAPHLLRLEEGQKRVVEENVHSNLFRSLCPVTGQPDFATIIVQYIGRPIIRAALLEYLISYRCHQGFHEATVEQIFVDIQAHCRPEQLSVTGRFLRRGGIDINPFRSDVDDQTTAIRLPRQ